MGKIENSICEAVKILVDQAVSALKVDQTILCSIVSCEDEGLKKYKVKYQDSIFLAYAQGENKYTKDTSVYVLIPSGDSAKDKLIVGTASDLGNAYITAATAEDKMTKIGSNIFTNNVNFSLCSYKNADTDSATGSSLISKFGIDTHDIDVYKEDSEYIMIAAEFSTKLQTEQQLGHGDYGIVVTCVFYNDDTKENYERKYTINVASMLGQPYKFTVPARQYGIFPIEGNNFVSIKEVAVYSQGFPVNKSGQPDDIFVSNFEFWFMQPLNEDEIAGTSLHIVTPNGAYFKTSDDSSTTKSLVAEIKIKGSAINGADTENIDYYWFVRDTSITADVSDDHSRRYYSSLGGEGWRCLNARISDSDSVDIDPEPKPEQFIPDGYKKTISIVDCPSSDNKFKCVAIMEETILQGIVKFGNEKANYFISLSNKDNAYSTAFAFETAYNFQVLATVLNSRKQDISDSEGVRYYWSFEADGGTIQTLSEKSRVLKHDPNIAIKVITYLVSVYDTANTTFGVPTFLGTAELTFVNSREQKEYNLVLNNGTRVFKYDEEGVSPNSNSIPPKERIEIFPLSFELYDRNGRIIGEASTEKIKLFKGRWLWPVDNGHNTMLKVDYGTAGLSQVTYGGESYWELPIVNESQLSFNYNIKNDYYIESQQNNIILEIAYQGILNVVTTNFTFTKEGELGTNGTKYSVRLQPVGEADIQQVFSHGDRLLYWKYNDDGSIKVGNFNGRFNLQLWDGGTEPILNQSEGDNVYWEILPRSSTGHNVGLASDSKHGWIKSNYPPWYDGSTILQGRVDNFNSSRTQYYGTYAINSVSPFAARDELTVVITGGYDHVVYAVNGKRTGFQNTLPFVYHRINLISNTEEFDYDEQFIRWTASWDPTVIKRGRSVEFEPPEQMGNNIDNYIFINDNSLRKVIISIHFYLNRYSMSAMNGWDGTGIEVNKEKNYILTPQLAAGIKNEQDNTFTGIAIGKSFSKDKEAKDEVGLMGFNNNVRTIFLDAEDGSATFGTIEPGTGCLQIKPDEDKNEVLISLYGSKEPSFNNDKTALVGGQGAALCFSAEDNNYLYFGNHFYVKQRNTSVVDAFLDGTIIARSGKIGGWKIENNSLASVVKDDDKGFSSQIILDANTPSITITSNKIDSPIIRRQVTLNASDGLGLVARGNKGILWKLVADDEGEGSFSVGQSSYGDSSFIKYEKEKLTMRGSIAGTNWYINQNGTFSFSNEDESIQLRMSDTGRLTLKGGDLYGDGWYINKNGSFRFGSTNRNYIKYDVEEQSLLIDELKDRIEYEILQTLRTEERHNPRFNDNDLIILSNEAVYIVDELFRSYSQSEFITQFDSKIRDIIYQSALGYCQSRGALLDDASYHPNLRTNLDFIKIKDFIVLPTSDLYISSTSADIQSDYWQIRKNGSFAFGVKDPETRKILGLSFTPPRYTPDPTDPDAIIATDGKLEINNTNLKGNNWTLYSDGDFNFGDSTNYVKFDNNKFTIRVNDITLQSSNWHLDTDGDFTIIGDIDADIRSIYNKTIITQKFRAAKTGMRYANGNLKIKGGTVQGDNWAIYPNGSFTFGKRDGSNLSYTPTSDNQEGDVPIESTGGKLVLKNGDIKGDNWHINADGDLLLGRGDTSIRYDASNNRMTVSANLEGVWNGIRRWFISQDGNSFSLGGGTLDFYTTGSQSQLTIQGRTQLSIGSSDNLFSVNPSGDVVINGNCRITTKGRNRVGLLLGTDINPAKVWRTSMTGYMPLKDGVQEAYTAEVLAIGTTDAIGDAMSFVVSLGTYPAIYCPKVYTDWAQFCKACGYRDPSKDYRP